MRNRGDWCHQTWSLQHPVHTIRVGSPSQGGAFPTMSCPVKMLLPPPQREPRPTVMMTRMWSMFSSKIWNMRRCFTGAGLPEHQTHHLVTVFRCWRRQRTVTQNDEVVPPDMNVRRSRSRDGRRRLLLVPAMLCRHISIRRLMPQWLTSGDELLAQTHLALVRLASLSSTPSEAW